VKAEAAAQTSVMNSWNGIEQSFAGGLETFHEQLKHRVYAGGGSMGVAEFLVGRRGL
jgi:hypothetical protein